MPRSCVNDILQRRRNKHVTRARSTLGERREAQKMLLCHFRDSIHKAIRTEDIEKTRGSFCFAIDFL